MAPEQGRGALKAEFRSVVCHNLAIRLNSMRCSRPKQLQRLHNVDRITEVNAVGCMRWSVDQIASEAATKLLVHRQRGITGSPPWASQCRWCNPASPMGPCIPWCCRWKVTPHVHPRAPSPSRCTLVEEQGRWFYRSTHRTTSKSDKGGNHQQHSLKTCITTYIAYTSTHHHNIPVIEDKYSRKKVRPPY